MSGLADELRPDFPILRREVRGRPLRYLDNAATTQKPRAVVDALRRFYEEENANVHRGVHFLSERATVAYDAARTQVRRFLNAEHDEEIIFVRGTTEALNLVAASFGWDRLQPGDEILLTHLEHHSNIVPWQQLCRQTGATLKVVPVNDRGELVLEEADRLLGASTRVFALTHLSNALGTLNPVKELVALAHSRGVPVVVDGAQAVAHGKVDVRDLGCDFYAFSGHKVYGPTGIGVLYGRRELLERMPPYQSGGDMIDQVSFEETTFAPLPAKFEAGTPNVAGAIGLAAALRYVEQVGKERIEAHERELLAYGERLLQSIPGVRVLSAAAARAGVLSFVLDGVHPHDLGTALDRGGVAVRAGHHCAQPLMARLGVTGTVRASLAAYNDRADLDALHQGLLDARRFFL